MVLVFDKNYEFALNIHLFIYGVYLKQIRNLAKIEITE